MQLKLFKALCVILPMCVMACAEDDSSTQLAGQQQSAALGSGQDACMASCTDERGIEPERCEELCSGPEDATCYTTCIDDGGTEEACRTQCYAAADCHAACLSDGTDDAICRQECAREGDTRDGSAMDDCITSCIDDGGDPATCRQTCAEQTGASTGNEADTDPCSAIATDAYESCIANGGNVEACRQDAAEAYDACSGG